MHGETSVRSVMNWIRRVWLSCLTLVWLCRELVAEGIDFLVRTPALRASITNLHGPDNISYDRNEVIAVCVVKNGELYIRSFIEHHFALGVKHIVFLDNGSTDNTVEIARQYQNVTVLQSDCRYHKYENAMKRYLARRFSRGRWCLFCDIDELFDYPFSDILSLGSLLDYLNQHSFTAVVAQMLDLFSGESISNDEGTHKNSVRDVYTYYDISNIQKKPYKFGRLSNQSIKMYLGGIRKTVFGTNNGLTKVPLFFLDSRIRIFVAWHHVRNARIADFTAVLLHYPFAGSFSTKVFEAVETQRYGKTWTKDYKKYMQVLVQNPALRIREETARELESVAQLVEDGFLVLSEEYKAWARARSNHYNG
ncbi:MAG: glycosyltransferase family 2 protein [Chloroflexota bacterium]|nr:glycosyltransferase family 2 protein [Chloroflexota bacterium]